NRKVTNTWKAASYVEDIVCPATVPNHRAAASCSIVIKENRAAALKPLSIGYAQLRRDVALADRELDVESRACCRDQCCRFVMVNLDVGSRRYRIVGEGQLGRRNRRHRGNKICARSPDGGNVNPH